MIVDRKVKLTEMIFSFAILSFFAASISAQELVDIPTTAINAGTFGTLVAALQAADLVDALSDPNGPFTVFAPSDDAFSLLASELVPCLLLPENNEVLSTILTYHVVEGSIFSTDLEDGSNPETLNGETISIDLSNGVTINGVTTVVTPDIETSNGVIHVLDSGKQFML